MRFRSRSPLDDERLPDAPRIGMLGDAPDDAHVGNIAPVGFRLRKDCVSANQECDLHSSNHPTRSSNPVPEHHCSKVAHQRLAHVQQSGIRDPVPGAFLIGSNRSPARMGAGDCPKRVRPSQLMALPGL